jgi:hypothetical protein
VLISSRGARAKGAVAALLIVVGASCATSGSDDRSASPASSAAVTDATADPPGSATTEAPAPVETFVGSVDEFYVVPDPLPAGEPGDLIRIQRVAEDASSVTLRIMYHSRDAGDRDRAVTGMLTYPTATAPDGGWPVVSLANGTVGLSSNCALSRRGQTAPTFGVEGVGVVTDYIGLGPVGEIHPYLSKPSEGHSVIDAVRAAGNLDDAGAGDRWFAVGHSQGGHGALSAMELGETYAPELDLVGTVSLAPAALFDRSYGGLDDIVTRMVGVMGFYGAAAEHPEIVPADYVGPETAAASAVIETGCLDQIVDAFLPVPAETFYTNDPYSTEPARSILLANDVGSTAVDSPLLLVSGTADDRVVVQRVRDLYDQLCDVGQVTEYLELDGANHGNEYALAATQIEGWLANRLAGAPAPDTCAT